MEYVNGRRGKSKCALNGVVELDCMARGRDDGEGMRDQVSGIAAVLERVLAVVVYK